MTGFGDLVRRQRMAAGLTQAELAELTGLSIRSICDLERGATKVPRRSSMALIKQALNLSDADLSGQPAVEYGEVTEQGPGKVVFMQLGVG